MSKRAEQMDDTRQRIVEATMYLHASVGPARTTIAAVAERAGVTRLTVYRHFPDDEGLFFACSAHWLSQQQPPNPLAWSESADPAERLRLGFADLYRYYHAGESMLVRINADMSVLPARLRQDLHDRDAHFLDVLLEPFADSSRGKQLRAVVGHAISFWTWRSLCHDHGLSNSAAVEAMTTLALATAAIHNCE
jgi:AcrR family transcriptional regulator